MFGGNYLLAQRNERKWKMIHIDQIYVNRLESMRLNKIYYEEVLGIL
jgi:hypothetical protein